MEEALIARMLATAGITDLVGQRVTPKRRTQGGDLPAVVLHRIDGGPDYPIHGGASGLIESRVQVDCWAESWLSAATVARAVMAALSGATFTQDGVRFDAIFVVAQRDDTDDENGTPLFRFSLDLMVHHATA